jgi:hypothetical protein
MSDVLWWREESWWERKSIPLFGFNLAPRQLMMLSSSGLLGFAFSSALPRSLLFCRIGVFLFFLSIGFVFATKRVKMAPMELQLYYRFVRKQGVMGIKTPAPRVVPQQVIPEAKLTVNHRPLLLGTVIGCLLATASLSVLATSVELRATGEVLLAFVMISGAPAFMMDRKLRTVGRVENANGVDELLSGIVLSAVLCFIALRISPLSLIPEVTCAFLIVRGLLNIGRLSPRKISTEAVATKP